ncbi:MAG: ABC transporter permease subunit [Hyphomicrobiales bacterium]|nr:ABC transporter permease subunit [Hyphomicrobiales bacterium]MDE2017539.1 ABC transporter permease subunit [Hyphomicrobiales bacterium]
MESWSLLGFGARGWGPALLAGAGMTLLVSAAGLLVGAVIGSLVAYAKIRRRPWQAALATGYTTVFRGVPELLVVYFVYFGSSALLTDLAHLFGAAGFYGVPSFAAGALAVGAISGAYQAEVYRGAFGAVAKGEIEAARAVGMSPALAFRRVIAPQVLRFAIPGLGNLWQVALKDSSLISVTGLVELMRISEAGTGSTRQPFPFYLAAGGLYLALAAVSDRAFASAEARATRGLRRVSGAA